jgi:DNA repair protein RecO (recombination protein O)
MSKLHPAEADSAFVLHTYPYRETSLIVETFARHAGRVSLIARGARRPRAALRGVLSPFQPLLLSWFGKGELKTLKSAEPERIYPQLSGSSLLSAFYLNELILKLAHRDDPHEKLFDAYDEAVHSLQQGMSDSGGEPKKSIAAVLRRFEKRLLTELGYGLMLDREADTGKPIHAQGRYVFIVERGALPEEAFRNAGDGALQLSGKTLLDLAHDDYDDPITAQQAKQLMRYVINHYLDGAQLHTRQIIKELSGV